MEYKVGQVLFVIMSKKNQVYPMQVVERIVKTTLSGDKVEYLLQAGPDKATTILLDKVDGEVFGDPRAVLEALTQRASTQIKKLVGLAVTKAGEWYAVPTKMPDGPTQNLPDLEAPAVSAQGEYEMVTMPDGTVMKVKMPTNIEQVTKYVGEE